MTVVHLVKVIIWGSMSARVLAVEGMMNAAKHIMTLKTRMFPSAKDIIPEGDFIFPDDSMPCHRGSNTELV